MLIEEHGLQTDWRRRRNRGDLAGIHHHEAFGSGEPQGAVPGFAACWLEARRAGKGGHAIPEAVGQATHCRAVTVRATLKLRFCDADNTAAGTQPQEPKTLMNDGADILARPSARPMVVKRPSL